MPAFWTLYDTLRALLVMRDDQMADAITHGDQAFYDFDDLDQDRPFILLKILAAWDPEAWPVIHIFVSVTAPGYYGLLRRHLFRYYPTRSKFRQHMPRSYTIAPERFYSPLDTDPTGHPEPIRQAEITEAITTEPDPDQTLMLQEALAALDPRERLLLLLYHKYDHPQPLLAAMLNIPQGTCSRIIHEARHKARQAITEADK